MRVLACLGICFVGCSGVATTAPCAAGDAGVADADLPAPDAGSRSDAGPPPSLLFWSGFEGATELATPTDCYSNGCWQDIAGADDTTGFSWPPAVAGGTSRFQLLVNGPAPTPSTV